MTIDEIMASDADMLTPYDIAAILGSNPETLRQTAKDDPDALAPLQPIRTGNRVKFPRKRFIGWYYGSYHSGPCLLDNVPVFDRMP